MFILYDILGKFKNEFAHSRKGNERGIWFVYTIIAIIIPFTSSKTSNILRCLNALFGFTGIRKKRFYTFMASPKIPWDRLWQALWKMIPCPETDGRLLLALDDCINPKTGKKVCYFIVYKICSAIAGKTNFSQKITPLHQPDYFF